MMVFLFYWFMGFGTGLLLSWWLCSRGYNRLRKEYSTTLALLVDCKKTLREVLRDVASQSGTIPTPPSPGVVFLAGPLPFFLGSVPPGTALDESRKA